MPVYEQIESVTAPVADIPSCGVGGFRYINFGTEPPKTVTVEAEATAPVTVNVRVGHRDGDVIATLALAVSEGVSKSELTVPVTGKHAVYFEFLSEHDGTLTRFDRFTFDRSEFTQHLISSQVIDN